MPVTTEKFDQLKIDKLKHYLEDMASKGHARPFEIFVDNLKIVLKTEDPKDFDNYEYYMNEDTEKVRILIYNSSLSPRNDQYCFYVQQNKTEKPLHGLGDIENIVQEKLNAREREYELTRLKEELEETKKRLEESEEYAEGLQNQLELANSNKYKLGNLDLVQLGALAIGKFAEKNHELLQKVGLEGLSGANNKVIETGPCQETEATFQKKTETETEIDPSLSQYLPFIQQLDAAFDKSQLETLMQIIQKLSEEPSGLASVAELLKITKP